MKVQINDCTIRDGGYLLNKDPRPAYVASVFEGLLRSGIDVIEIGFLQKATNGESVVYGNAAESTRHVPSLGDSSRFTGFCDNSRYSIDLLEPNDGTAFDYLKISFAKHESKEALHFVEQAKEKGYKVFANPMDALSYDVDERAAMIEEINRIKPYCFSIVDTFGAMYLDDLESIFLQIDEKLDRSIRIGLHSHNNLQLSNALAERMIDLAHEADRSIVVDASLYGMGRGAGNASTEVIAAFLNEKYGYDYDLGILFDTIEQYVAPLSERIRWGYDLQMFACGILGAHVDNISHLQSLERYTARQQFDAMARLEPAQRKRYGAGYSKSDFSALDKSLEQQDECVG